MLDSGRLFNEIELSLYIMDNTNNEQLEKCFEEDEAFDSLITYYADTSYDYKESGNVSLWICGMYVLFSMIAMPDVVNTANALIWYLIWGFVVCPPAAFLIYLGVTYVNKGDRLLQEAKEDLTLYVEEYSEEQSDTCVSRKALGEVSKAEIRSLNKPDKESSRCRILHGG